MHLWTFYLDGIYRKVEFWDSKISGKKKIAVDSKVLALDDSGCSHYKCTFSIAPHILKLIQIDEDNFDLIIDGYKFIKLMSEEKSGNLQKMLDAQEK